MQHLKILLFTTLISIFTSALSLNDGPYLIEKNNQFYFYEVKSDSVISRKFDFNKDDLFTRDENDNKIYFNLNKSILDKKSKVGSADSLVIVSDIHGQHNIFVKLLKNNNIIGDSLQWTFGNGLLVIDGDVFDRGEKVTESLWLILKLKSEAQQFGGDVIYLLGNHEVMNVKNKIDVRYVNKKYFETAKKLNMTYDELWDKNSILGNWIRSLDAITIIDSILICHAGISYELSEKYSSIYFINKEIRENLSSQKTINNNFLTKSNGPVWYRGYFKNQIDNKQVQSTLDRFNVSHIIVGHTTHKNRIFSLYDGKVIAVDGGIKYGEAGLALKIQNKKFIVIDEKGNNSALINK